MNCRASIAAIALVLASCASSGTTKSGSREAVNTAGRTSSTVYSNAILANDTLYLSGKLGLDPETGQVPASIEREITLALDGLVEVLAEKDMTMNDLVSVTVFCTDPALYDQFNEIYATYFDGDFPARAFIGSGPLLRGAHFEVKGIAVRRP